MAVKVLGIKERIEMKMGDLSFWVSPMTYRQKSEIAGCSRMVEGELETDTVTMAFKSVKFCLKDFKGIETFNGEEYRPEFEKNGDLTDDCTETILNIVQSAELSRFCLSFLSGIQEQLVDGNGKPIEGVEIIFPKKEIKKK